MNSESAPNSGATLVVGLGASGQAIARQLRLEGCEVVAVDDSPDEGAIATAEELGIVLVERPGVAELARVARNAAEVVVSPGIPFHHPIFSVSGIATPVSEVEMAWRRATAPIIAITGTNGKTTVATLVTRMLQCSGIRAEVGGNIGVPLTEVVAAASAEVIVAEVSSFQLALCEGFKPRVGVWLNAGEDHLDWHPDLGHYVRSKARIWQNQDACDVAVANAEDEMVMLSASKTKGRLVTFGLEDGDFRLSAEGLLSPDGGLIIALSEIRRAMNFEISNALAACAASLAAGASIDGCRRALAGFNGLPHRVELVRDVGGVRYIDDSKATTPAAVLAAVRAFNSVVLIAGGRNKGLSMAELADGVGHLRGVVAIGEAASEIEKVFKGLSPVVTAGSMAAAVEVAASMAVAGDVVLLSPACASFDWYASYADRGEDFKRAVHALRSPVGTAANLEGE